MKTISGDLIELGRRGKFDIIVHGCNCFHAMGSGIAGQLARIFPGPSGPVEIDKRTSLYGDRDKLGTYTVAYGTTYNDDDFIIVNGYTQFRTASPSEPSPVDYKAIRSVFSNLAAQVVSLRIGYPAIGAGLAGGDWSIISQIIDEELEGLDHTYVEYDPTASLPVENDAERNKRIAQTLRDGIGADLFYDPWVNYTGADDDWANSAEQQITEVIEAMEAAATILDTGELN